MYSFFYNKIYSIFFLKEKTIVVDIDRMIN